MRIEVEEKKHYFRWKNCRRCDPP